MSYNADYYLHDSDRAALKALRAIPGFSTLVRWFMNNWNEPQERILNMSTRVKLGPTQLPEYYNMLPPICEKLGIEVPELYVEMNVLPNSYTYGDTHPYIVVTSGLLNTLPRELVATVLAHECGHIACHHVLFNTMGRMILSGAFSALGMIPKGGLLSLPLQVAFFYWLRCSEFSADRAAVLVDGGPEKMQEVCFRLAGMDSKIAGQEDIGAFIEQAKQYRTIAGESLRNRTLEFLVLSRQTHPLMAVRALECGEWAGSDRFRELTQHRLPESAGDGKVSRIMAEYGPDEDLKRDGGAEAEGAGEPEEAGTFWDKLKPIFDAFQPAPGAEDGMEADGAPAAEAGGEEIAVGGMPLTIPEGYRRLRTLPMDPPESAGYGLEKENAVISLLFSPIDAADAMPFDYPQAVIEGTREALDETQGLVEVGSGKTGAGRKFIYSIVKEAAEDGTVDYTLTLHLAYADRALSVHGFYDETSGVSRESSVWAMKRKREDAGAWSADPYDPEYKLGFLRTRAEDREADAFFPDHPLSLLRNFVEFVTKHN